MLDMNYLVCCLALLFSILNLYSVKIGNKKLKMATKPFLVPLIFISFALNSSVIGNRWLLFLIASLYCCGDILLMFDNKYAFYIGAISFACGHICFATYFILFNFDIVFAFLGLVLYLTHLYFHVKKLKSVKKDIKLELIYSSLIGILVVSIFGSLKLDLVSFDLFAVVGIILFVYSDSRIAYSRVKIIEKNDFEIMLTYILAIILILISVVYMRGSLLI